MKRLIVLAALAVAACGGSEQEARERVAAQLRDPNSAQFRNINMIAQSTGGEAVCGEVNGRNAFGAYSGFQRFVFYGGVVSIEPDLGVSPSAADYEASMAFLRRHTRLCIQGGDG